MHNDPDISLVRRFKEGDQGAFNQIVRRYQERLYYLALRMVGNHDDALDISQDAFVKAYEGLEKFHGDSSLYTWLYRIVVNLSINHRRKRKVIRFVSFEDVRAVLASTKDSPDEVVNRKEFSEAADEAIEGLPARQKAIFVLRYYQGLSHQEISEILGRSVGAVKASYFHAVRKLRKALSKFVETEEPE